MLAAPAQPPFDDSVAVLVGLMLLAPVLVQVAPVRAQQQHLCFGHWTALASRAVTR